MCTLSRTGFKAQSLHHTILAQLPFILQFQMVLNGLSPSPITETTSLVLKPVSYRCDTAFCVAPGSGCVCSGDERHL